MIEIYDLWLASLPVQILGVMAIYQLIMFNSNFHSIGKWFAVWAAGTLSVIAMNGYALTLFASAMM